MASRRVMFYFVFTLFFILAQLPSGCQAGHDCAPFVAAGKGKVCDTCKPAQGKCGRICLEKEKVESNCMMKFFCCWESH